MNLLFIFTGGTIGSMKKDGFISPDKSSKGYILLEKYRERYGIGFDFDTVSPYTILSENLTGTFLNSLIDCISDNLKKNAYDGIIITHGTDTLHYSASALEYAFSDSTIPIILVSSNYILDDERANGISNLRNAILFMSDTKIGGVFVSYRNQKGLPFIHRGNLLLAHSQYSDSVESVSNASLGSISDGHFSKTKSLIDINTTYTTPLKKNYSFYSEYSDILYIKVCPGMCYPTVTKDTKAVLIESYHSGTICENDRNLKRLTDSAIQNNIPVFLTGVEERTAYESTKCFDDYKLIILPKASYISMYMKLWLITSSKEYIDAQNKKEFLINEMETPFAYEYLLN